MTREVPNPVDAGAETEAGQGADAGTEVTRRALLRGAAVSGVALPLLAACGGSSGSSGGSGGGSGGGSAGGSGGSGGGGASGKVTLKESQVPVGGGKILASDKVVVTQPSKGDFKAFSAICTHQGCTVGTISGGEIICPCHGSHYSIKDGSVTSGPAPSPLPAKKLVIKNGDISVS
jgi:nitrite reductase/ring-hydroxylating ferredoxin subunit